MSDVLLVNHLYGYQPYLLAVNELLAEHYWKARQKVGRPEGVYAFRMPTTLGWSRLIFMDFFQCPPEATDIVFANEGVSPILS